jgi:mRNA-degrading endonuclease toxin of MazEF toxin-antitoxin module
MSGRWQLLAVLPVVESAISGQKLPNVIAAPAVNAASVTVFVPVGQAETLIARELILAPSDKSNPFRLLLRRQPWPASANAPVLAGSKRQL